MTALGKLDSFHESGDPLAVVVFRRKGIAETKAEGVLAGHQEPRGHRELDVFPLIGERRRRQSLVVEYHRYCLGRETIRRPCGDNSP